MSKPYTEDDFTHLLTTDRTWRIKEISDLKSAIRNADAALEKVLLRALVTISYAHWEGHVKNAARLYLTHIALRKFPFSKLDNQFLKNYFLPRLTALSTNRTSLAARCELLEDVLAASEQQFSRFNPDLVNARSNLNAEVLREICIVCGIPFEPFETHESFIDTILLKRRNSIAHGEETFIEKTDLDDLSTKTISLMRMFGDGLDNKVQLKTYRAA
ncbi:MAE_28990/MAE_18760 family HEPN-like nuclease [Roseobacter sp. OBYS 0001]|uniref:MAE_28990/MAE_18760 family HEPN-like nuclease n=1 Tax=Roseobacter sp. OBYS 0001 TaxID=882651 RepID=UPI001BBE7F03|nr:MAE_28990/MAE_18760 family HEPN-like nuclease [Roseobacter sp. OBYS 0001]GIT86981.1 hypothetical protein ROBYS_19970 [Roseobacter sp. OBYS 0001]